MSLSETIVAAIIGALATMLTAIVQLIRNRAPSEVRPKKKRMRSVVAIGALMFGCVVGGYFWSEYRRVSAKEELAATIRAELEASLQAMSGKKPDAEKPLDLHAPKAALAAQTTGTGSAESLAHLPPCRLAQNADEAGPTACSDAVAPAVALCAAVPSSSQTVAIHVHARVPGSESPWLERDAGAATLGNLHIAPEPFEYPASADKRSVCLSVSNWSVEETLAVRVVVDYEFGGGASPELTASAPAGQAL